MPEGVVLDEERIEDLQQLATYMNKIDKQIAWEQFSPTEPYNEEKAIIMRRDGLDQINFEINQIKDNLNKNKYGERTTSGMDDLSYFMEVVETIDSIAIAKVTGSKMPIYKIRIGDDVVISN